MATGSRFQPSGQHELGPAGKISRITANLEAIRTLRVIQDEHRPAAPGEQAIMARWSGWGAVPQIFDERKDEYAGYRTQMRALLSQDEYAAARRSALNAHYTDAAVVQAVWDAVAGLGFDGGDVLEPGCGSGNFIGFAPASARMLGIELDPVTAGIAAALYPDAEIRNESFADTRVPEGGFDLVIGNVPFSNAILTDDRHNPSRYSMHNHFILKSLAATRPGGLVAVLTSRYTMDAIADAARGDMAGQADLITAIRLPTGAHRRAAGTDAVTDLIILRRREDGRPRAATDWEESVTAEFKGGTGRVSEYFTAHPENVLGTLVIDGGQYSAEELTVRPRDLSQVPDDLAARLALAVSDAHERGLAMSPRASWHATADVRPGGGHVSLRIPARDASRFEGTITAHSDGTFTVLRDGQSEPWPCPDSQAAELRALLRLRDTVSSLLDAERASSQDTPRLGELRERLNREYDAYVAAHGPLNRMSWRRTGRTDENGNDTWARQAPAQGKFRQDPYAAAVYALEDFDPETGTASKAPIFTQRVIADRQPAETADTPADAIAICMDADGQVRLERAASLLGSPSLEEARAALGDLVYDEPGTGRLVPAAEYLSGKVRDKLAAAEKAAGADPKFGPNVTALRKVLPADLTPGEIDARLGASWIPPEYVQQGLREILHDTTLTVVKGYGSSWQVKGNTHSLEARDVYGTADKDAIALAQCLLELRPIKVSYSMDDLTPAEKERLSSARGREDMAAFMRARAAAATVAARGKADELSDRFSEWLWEDPKRTAELTRTYNEKFNSLVLRSYDDARPRLPGLAEWFKPHPHQYAAVARIVNEPAALLAHEVGAGKTAEMAMGCMELRRLGLVSKPAIIVPNHMLEQFQREFLQLYPQAKVLACGSRDLQKERRHTFVARIATADWDAVIMSRSVFERIPMSAAEQERYIKAKLAAYDRWLERAAIESEDTRMVKRMEKQRLSFEERLKRKLSRARDAGISWEQTGIDYLLVDEAHGYKNLDTRSNSPALDIDGSGRAADLEMKLDCLRRENGQRIVTFATATPIANSMTEAYVMLSYLRPDLLKDAGIEDFDGWAGSFTSTSTDVEVAPEGGIRVKERVSRFRNLPELLLMWRVVADVKTAEELNLPVPELAGGKPEVVTIPPSGELRAFMLTLASRAENVRTGRVEPKEDNMLKISSDGRAAALDLRLAGLSPPAEAGKLDIAAARIAQIYRDTKDSTYADRDGNPEPVTGSLQIVFCELGTPTGSGKFGAYEYLKAQLADRGVPAAQVRFMHEAKNDKEKADLFAAARAGKVSVLVGTTELMGVGTNVQKRAAALHHLDCPWRPADVAQREGRILRQGNQNDRVQIIRYVTEGSFDAYMWQTVLRKAKFIAQVMHGRLDSREIEDIGGSEALSYSEVTALATGDMRILLKARADAEVQRLIKLETSWKRSKRHLRARIADGERDIPRLRKNAARLEAAIGQRTPMKGDAFRCELNGKHLAKRTEAAAELQSVLEAEHQRAVSTTREEREIAGATSLGTFGGLSLEAKGGIDSFGSYVDLRFPEVPNGSVRIRSGDSELGVVTKLENKLSGLDGALAETRQQITGTEAEIKRAQASLDAPFAKATELNRARYESDRLAAELGGQRVLPQEPEAHQTPAADAGAERDSDQDDDVTIEEESEAWAAAGTGADLDENPLEEAGFTSDVDDDEWDEEPDAEPAEAAAAEPDATAPLAGRTLGDGQREPVAAGESVPAASEQETAAAPVAVPAPPVGAASAEPASAETTASGPEASPDGTGPVDKGRPAPSSTTSPSPATSAPAPAATPTITTTSPAESTTTPSSPASASTAPATAPGGMRPTPEQQAIIDACASGQNLVIEAGAGTGKTSTLRLAATAMNGRNGLYVAYNRSIADEARRSFPANVSCSTAHSLAFRAIGRNYSHRLNSKRLPAREIAQLLGIRQPLQVSEDVLLPPEQLAQIAMGTVKTFCRSADPALTIKHVPRVNGVDSAGQEELARTILASAAGAWSDLQRLDGRLPFTPDHYLKMWQLTRPNLNADFVLFDEAQDANPVIADIVQSQRSSQLIAVGDSCQAINGWNGAIDALATWPADQRLYLSQSFRFGTEIADEANKWLENLGAALRLKGTDRIQSSIGSVASPDAVLCRTNATGVAQALALLEDGKRVALVGGGDDIKRLAEAARELQLSGYTNHPELTAFRSWGAVLRYVESDESGSDLRTFVKLVDSHGPGNVIRVVNQLTGEDHADVTVSTAHKSKGREWDRVRMADDFREPATTNDAIPRPDAMLAYVSVTRAKLVLDRGGLAWIDNYATGQPDAETEQETASTGTSTPAREQAAITVPPAATADQPEQDRQPANRPDGPVSVVPSKNAAKSATTASPASPPKRVPEPEAAPEPPAAAPANGSTPTIRIEHDDEGTRVYGTDKSQKPVIKALKDQGFKWSRKQGYWYLNRTWRRGTREDRVRRLKAALNDLGIVPESSGPQPGPESEIQLQAANETQAQTADATSALVFSEQAPESAAEPTLRSTEDAHTEATSPSPASSSFVAASASTSTPPWPSASASGAASESANKGVSPPAQSSGSTGSTSAAKPAVSSTGNSTGYEQDSLFGLQDERNGQTASSTPNSDTSASARTTPESNAAAPEQPGEPGSTRESKPSAAGPNASEPAATPVDEQAPAAAGPVSAPQETAAPAQAASLSSLADIPVDPRPYRAGRHQAESGSRIIESDYAGWLSTRQHPSDSRLPKEHPRVQQLIVRWKAVHAKGIADGPGPSAARYHALAHAALALATATDGTSHPRELDALNRLATDARKFSVRLRATAEHNFDASDKASMYRGGRGQAERGSRMVEADFRTWSRTGAPPEAARDLNLWEQARRAELAWHAIRRSGLHDGPGPAAARYRELADATRALSDGFSPNLSSSALLPLFQLTDHARKHAIRLEATEHARTAPGTVHARDDDRHNGGDAYGNLPSELAVVTRKAYAAQHRPENQQSSSPPSGPIAHKKPAYARQGTDRGRD